MRLGTVSGDSILAGETVYLLFYPQAGFGFDSVDSLVIYSEEINKFVFLGRGSGGYFDPEITKEYVGGSLARADDVVAPRKIDIPNSDSRLVYASYLGQTLFGGSGSSQK